MSAVTSSFPVRRQDFEFSEVPRHWVESDPFMTHVFNALSALFPDGERFFVASVRAVREKVEDPQLQKDIGAFIGQEAMHAKEHGNFNAGAINQGFDIPKLEGWTRRFLSAANLPLLNNQRVHLAATVALEHFTGILSAQLLRREDLVELIDPSMRDLWAWHCIEENEHKAVAFDTFAKVYGKGIANYAIRMGVMALATTLIMIAIHAFIVELMREDKELGNLKSWVKGLNRLWGPKGMFTQIVPEYLDYFKPKFHPWDHDTNFLLHQWRKRVGFSG
ncbi:metal-dependent hydrolase [Marinobacter mobilis]|uniref:metal-dependent hydrolase n=1 Tax=Marinobacter mobilis TaxID=488533 RepID=UPI0035C707DA